MKKPRRVSAALEEVLSSLGLSSVTWMVRLSAAWEGIVGPLLSGKTFPARLKNGVLTVIVQNHAWAQELQLKKPALMERVNTVLGMEPLRDIRFLVGPLPAGENEERDALFPDKEFSRFPPFPEPQGLSGVRDPETREILKSLSRKAARRKT